MSVVLADDPDLARQAYGRLVVRHENRLRGLLRYLTRDPALADDLAQETFLQAWQKLASLREPHKFAAWLKKLGYRQFLHVRRRQGVEASYLQSLMPVSEAGLADMDDDLQRVLRECEPLEAELLILQYGFGFTTQEIAAELAMPAGSVKSLVHRVKIRLQKLFLSGEALSHE